jgi:uncharacterized DUF497 family protein
MEFEWNEAKNQDNIAKHGYSFELAELAFDDSRRVIERDIKHSQHEFRAFCFGKVNGEVLTVRFNLRDGKIRIIGVSKWRKGIKIYEKDKAK